MGKPHWQENIGKRFGYWIVLERDFSFKGKYTKLICKCDCGVIRSVMMQSLEIGTSTNCGCIGNKSQYKKGMIIGNFTIIKLARLDECGRTWWEVKCNKCGNIINLRQNHLTKNNSCGCQFKKPDGITAFNFLFGDYKKKAKLRKLIFDLTEDEFKKIINGNCHYCGKEPEQLVKRVRRYPSGKSHISEYKYNGIDRVDSKLGYVINNVVSCCKVCNWIKRDQPVIDFVNHIKRIYLHLTKETSYAL